MSVIRKGLIPYQGYKHVIPIGQGVAFGETKNPPNTTTLGGMQTFYALAGIAVVIGVIAFIGSKKGFQATRKRTTKLGPLEISDYGGKDRTVGLEGLPFQLKLNR